jgi:hypothetical protein
MRRFVEILLAAGLGVAGTYWYVKKPRRRHRRNEHFLTQTSGTTMGISPDLLFTVHVLLQHALDERKRPVWRSNENHATTYAPTIVVMIATAMDAWLSELIAFARHPLHLPEEQVARVIDIGTTSDKYESGTELLLGRKLRANADLRTLSKIRNEIVHFLPYTQDITQDTVPQWLQYLDQKHLLISAAGDADFHFSQKLSSYALAYWACETAYQAAEQVTNAATPNQHLHHLVSANNFRVTAGIHSPEELHFFDNDHGITVTK